MLSAASSNYWQSTVAGRLSGAQVGMQAALCTVPHLHCSTLRSKSQAMAEPLWLCVRLGHAKGSQSQSMAGSSCWYTLWGSGGLQAALCTALGMCGLACAASVWCWT